LPYVQTAAVNGKANIHDLSANKIRFVEELNGTGFTCDRSGNIIAESAYFNYNTVALGGITAGNLDLSRANDLMLDVRGQAKIHGRSDFSLMFGEKLTLGKTDNSTINNNLLDVHGRINVRGNTNLGGTTTLFDVNIGNKANVEDLSTNTLFFTQRIDGPGEFSCDQNGDIIAHSAYFNYNTVALGGMTVGDPQSLSNIGANMLDVRGRVTVYGQSTFATMFANALTLGDSITLPPQNASTINSNLFDVRGEIIVYGDSNFGGTAQFVKINHSGDITNNSDYRLKTNITTLDETYTVNNLRPVRYFIEASEKEQIGVIAHELQEHFPSLVRGEKDGEKMQSVNYMGLIGVLINDIKSLNKKIDSLQEQIDALRA